MRTMRALSVVAVSLVAGTAAPVFAAAGQPNVATARVAAGTAVTLNGVTVRTTAARVSSPRVFTFPGSARVVAAWDEWNGGVRTGYFALSPDGARVTQVGTVNPTVRLRYAEFDPRAGAAPAVPAALGAPAGNELYIVQLAATPIDEMRRGLAAAGATIERYLPENAYLVRMTAAARQRVGALAYVRWVGAYEPAYRMSAAVRAEALAPGAAARYSIECLRSGMAQQQAVADSIRQLGGIVELTTSGQYRLEATLTPAQLLAVAKRNEVAFIDPWGGPGGTDMLVVRQLQGAVPALSDRGFTGQSVRGEVFDTEVLTTHVAFQRPPVLLHRGSAGSPPLIYHGSSCYGINFANWPAFSFFNGMVADAEQGIFLNYLLSTQFGGPIPRLTLNTEATDPAGPYRSSYQTSSVGSDLTTGYTSISAEVDDYLFRIDYLSFQSQSNAGSRLSRPQAWAKNIVSVGGINWNGTLDRSDDFFGGASFGPAPDGRQKPDLANCYDNVPTTTGTGDSATTNFGGTSAATPITAGGAGLLMQMWHEGVWPGFGGGSSVFADRPYSTTAKAMLINTAYRYPLAQGGLAREKQGWGMPDLARLYDLRDRTFIVNNSRPLQQGDLAAYTLTVAPGEPVLAATLCYIDPMPGSMATVQRVNDLSLRLTAPDGVTTYWGNSGLAASNFSAPGGAEDHLNTVENVFVQSPAAGEWTVEVLGTQVVQDAYPTGAPGVTPTGPADAAFSLVVSGIDTGIVEPPPCYANCDTSTTTPFLNINDFICFQQKFAAGDTYANCDHSTSPPVLNVNDFLCFQSSFAAGCSAP